MTSPPGAGGGELRPGQRFHFRRTFTDGDVSQFCGVTGDLNPFHLDDAFAAEHRFGARIVPGLLTASMVTHIGGLLGFLASEMTFRFVGPVFVGDTVSCQVTVAEVGAEGRVRAEAVMAKLDGATVIEATFAGRPYQVRLA